MAPPVNAYVEIYKLACGDNAEAFQFLMGWNLYVHSIDDLIDAEKKDPQKLLDTLALANTLYSLDFYQAHSQAFRMVVLLVTNHYADSLAWANSEIPWQKTWADTLRFAGNEMVLAVAAACGGNERVRAVSLKLRENSWNTHHANEQPV
jgi:hypothetical protein